MVIKAAFWPLGGQSETDPYDPGKVFFEVNEPTSPYVWSNGIGGVGSGSTDTASVFTGQEYSRGNHHGTGRLEYLRLKLDAVALAELDKNRGGVSRWLRFKRYLNGLLFKAFYYLDKLLRRLP